jgi:DNA invertase Pin-like site-specific DNA recombinase
MKIGYVRVSTKDQNTERQIKKMRELGIEERYTFIDKASGKDFNRPVHHT